MALAFAVLYGLAGWALSANPFTQSLLGNVVLLTTAATVVVTIWVRRRSWTGCQRLFWDVYAIGMAFWFFGHLGWAYGQLVQGDPSWLRWHTIFSLCGGIAPLIALIARPHRGARSYAVATTAVDLAAAGLLAVFIYSYFVLVPGLVPGAGSDPQARLLVLIQANRFLQLTGLLAAVWIGRNTAWHSTYVRLAAGVAIGAVLRIGTSRAIARGVYHPGTLHDLAWILPWLCYAWAAYFAPESKREDAIEVHEAPPAIAFSAVPVLLIPAIGYGMILFEPLGAPTDSFRSLLTGVTTVGGLGLLTIRLAAQRGALQRSDSRLRLLAAATERTADMILITRADGQLEHANEAFLKTLGYTRREVEQLGVTDLIGVECPELRAKIVKAVQEMGGWRGTLKRRRKDGSTFTAACTVSPLRNAAGTVTHYVGVERDISEELRLRDQLVHSERLSAIGELVAGVAHEINNPLQTIVGCVELMLDDRPGAASNRQDLETVRREAARAGQIVRNLLSFVRRGAPDRVSTDLTVIVRAMVDLREYHLRQRNIGIDARYAPEPLMAMVNRDEIQQLFLNLLLNAEHAIAGSGVPGTIRVTTGSARGRHFVEVADTGPGISPDLRGRIFEPFFTTKQVGEGTGLGLSISHGIAHAHGGSLELLDSERGARFTLTLPPVSEGDETAHSAAPSSGAAHAALVVDDEVPIRQLLARLLERRGYTVHTADTGAAALRLAASNHFSLVICDVRMPGVSGIELYRRFQENHGGSARHFVFMTGDTTSVDAIPLSDAQTSILPKPFTAADLDALLAAIGLPRGAD